MTIAYEQIAEKWSLPVAGPLLCVGNVLGVLRGEIPEIARAKAKADAKLGWELIYKREATLNGNCPPKLHLGPLALLSLDTPSLNPPCYSMPIPAEFDFHPTFQFTNEILDEARFK